MSDGPLFPPTFNNGGAVPVQDVTITTTGQRVTINKSDYNPAIHSSPGTARTPTPGDNDWNQLSEGGGTATVRVTLANGSYADIQSNQFNPAIHFHPRHATRGVKTYVPNPNPGYDNFVPDPDCTYEGLQPVDEGTPLFANYRGGDWTQDPCPTRPDQPFNWVIKPGSFPTDVYMPVVLWILKPGGTATHHYDVNAQFSLISNEPHDWFIPWPIAAIPLPTTTPLITDLG